MMKSREYPGHIRKKLVRRGFNQLEIMTYYKNIVINSCDIGTKTNRPGREQRAY